jgi:7-carboxy-7-deazaguanine synthase
LFAVISFVSSVPLFLMLLSRTNLLSAFIITFGFVLESLRITEIFYSLQGESLLMGVPTVFIRLTGCPLRCHYCDTEYAFSGGQRMTLEEIGREVAQYECRNICVTGGEPLAQQPCIELLSQLCDIGYEVSLETSGALSVETVDSRVIKVMDLKTCF